MIVLYIYIAHLLVKANASVQSVSQSQSTRGGPHGYLASINEMPHHVLIVHNNFYCSGSLIRSKVVVTVASCFVKWHFQRIVVKVGAETVTGMGQIIEAVAIKKHEYFGHGSIVDNDIALVMLKEHVTFSPNVKKIMMIEPEMALPVGTILDVSGWASPTFEPSTYANNFLWSEMTLLRQDECMKYFPKLMTNSNFCARYSPERHLSDNGGAAVFRDLLVGILSFGADSSVEPAIALFTNVSYFHSWINLNTKRFMKKYCVEPIEFYIKFDVDSNGPTPW